MADVQKLLKNILSAVYGKDVRQSIHDAIKQCYYDGKAGGNDLEARDRAAAAESRMDTFTSLKNGSTSGDAELMDIRVGLDGKKYGSAGSAVREQIRDTRTIEVSETEPTRENTVLWINPTERSTVYLNGLKDGKETTVALDHTVIRVKNAAGVWESIPAIGGESVYDMAVRHGYIGTEDEFMKELFSAGWVDACLQLEEKKVDKTEFESKMDGLDDGLDDRFQPIGTIMTSVRKDLGDKWLLCNGTIFSNEQYPDLYDVMSYHVSTPLVNFRPDCLEPGDQILDLIYGNGWYVMGGTDANAKTPVIYYSTDLITWTRRVISSEMSGIYDIKLEHLNDKFICFVTEDIGSGRRNLKLFNAVDPTGDWSYSSVWADSSALYMEDATYGNGYYVTLSSTSSGGMLVHYSMDLLSWASTSLSNVTAGNVDFIRYLNNQFVCGSKNILSYAGAPANTFTTVTLPDNHNVFDMVYVDGKYVLLSTDADKNLTLYTNTELNASWIAGKPVTELGTYESSRISKLTHVNGEYIFTKTETNELFVAYGADPAASMTVNSIHSYSSNPSSGRLNTTILENTLIVSDPTETGNCAINARNILPNISYDRAYAYIKAAE